MYKLTIYQEISEFYQKQSGMYFYFILNGRNITMLKNHIGNSLINTAPLSTDQAVNILSNMWILP